LQVCVEIRVGCRTRGSDEERIEFWELYVGPNRAGRLGAFEQSPDCMAKLVRRLDCLAVVAACVDEGIGDGDFARGVSDHVREEVEERSTGIVRLGETLRAIAESLKPPDQDCLKQRGFRWEVAKNRGNADAG
jgi:hypothetical protein